MLARPYCRLLPVHMYSNVCVGVLMTVCQDRSNTASSSQSQPRKRHYQLTTDSPGRSSEREAGCRARTDSLSSDRDGWREVTKHAWQKIPGYYNITWPPIHHQPQSEQRRWKHREKEAERGQESVGGGGLRHRTAQFPLFITVTERRREPIRHVCWFEPLPQQKSQHQHRQRDKRKAQTRGIDPAYTGRENKCINI